MISYFKFLYYEILFLLGKRKLFFKKNNEGWFTLHKLNGEYIDCSDNIKNIIGYTKEYVMNKSAYDFIHPDDYKNVIKSHLETKKRTIPIVYYRILNSDGNYIWVKTMSTQLSSYLLTYNIKC